MIAALNQVGIGLSVTLPVLIAVLATVGGILVVGVGGGLIGPMRQRWEGWLGQLEEDTRRVRESSGATPPPPADPGGTTRSSDRCTRQATGGTEFPGGRRASGGRRGELSGSP